MGRGTVRALIALSIFLFLLPLAVGRPGMPPTLKADEPAYFLSALSLAYDGDLRCELRDVRRLFDGYPFLPVHNLILMSTDGWETVYYGKPYIYSLLAVPLAGPFGANGLVAFNMALLLGMVWLGALYLSRFNSGAAAALFSALFFFLSTAFAYVFWLQPETLNMFAVMGCLFFAFHRFGDPDDPHVPAAVRWARRLFGGAAAPAWSGALLVLGVYNKPMIAAFALPALYRFWRERGAKAVAVWLGAAALAMALVAGGSWALTGRPSSYLGVSRAGMKVIDPEQLDAYYAEMAQFTAKKGENANSWQWIFRLPEIDFGELGESAYYFLLGRHTGLVPYMPFAAIAVLLLLVNRRRGLDRWLVLAALATVALFFLIFIPFNWHGGGGFIGNRYFVIAYPAFLFLVTRVRPGWATVAGAALAGPLVGAIVFTPYGAPVPKPTLQAHVRGAGFQLFPLELSLRSKIPGYDTMSWRNVHFLGRADRFKPHNRAAGSMWLHGAASTELYLTSDRFLDSLFFEVHSRAEDNVVTLRADRGGEVVARFEDARGPRAKHQTVELPLGPPYAIRQEWEKPVKIYRVWVDASTGRNPMRPDGTVIQPQFYLGAELTYLGTRKTLETGHHYRVQWRRVEAPERVRAGGDFLVPVGLLNKSRTPWDAEGPLPVNLSYRWLDEGGRAVVADGLRTHLAEAVPPGEILRTQVRVRAPEEPGSYRLVLDLVRENVAWFSRLGADVAERRVEVVTELPPEPTRAEPAEPAGDASPDNPTP